MDTLINLRNMQRFFVETNKDYIYAKKGFINKKKGLNADIKLVDDYNSFYYVPKPNNPLYSILNLKTFKNNKSSTLKVNANSTSVDFGSIYKSIKRNPTYNIEDKKEVLILDSVDNKCRVFYKGILGIMPIDEATNTNINFGDIFLKGGTKRAPKTVCMDRALVKIEFPTITFNFSNTKKRRMNEGEIYFTFLNHGFETKEIRKKRHEISELIRIDAYDRAQAEKRRIEEERMLENERKNEESTEKTGEENTAENNEQ